MLMVIAGAGASYDSVPARAPGKSSLEEARLPLADALFEPRAMFEEVQRALPTVMPIVPALQVRRNNQSVEDVLALFQAQDADYSDRKRQLAAVRFYLQTVISQCEDLWYRTRRVPTNMMALFDQIESMRRQRAHALFVTFNYDRLIEDALGNRGYRVDTIPDLIHDGQPPLFKLHGSVDWAHPVGAFDVNEFGGSEWQIAEQIISRTGTLNASEEFVRVDRAPSVRWKMAVTIPAIAIPLKDKSHFECPPVHVAHLRSLLPHVRTVVTIGWRGAETHFLNLLREHTRQHLEVICVGGSTSDADATVNNLRSALSGAHCEAYGLGFTRFVQEARIERLLNLTWGA